MFFVRVFDDFAEAEGAACEAFKFAYLFRDKWE